MQRVHPWSIENARNSLRIKIGRSEEGVTQSLTSPGNRQPVLIAAGSGDAFLVGPSQLDRHAFFADLDLLANPRLR
jgi:hypothetical protein